MAGEKVDPSLFWVRLERLRQQLPKGVGSLAIVRGINAEDLPEYLRTFSLQVFLTRKEIANTIIVITKDRVAIAGKNAAEGIMSSLGTEHEGKKVELLSCAPRKDENGEVLKKLLEILKEGGGKVGLLPNDFQYVRGEFFGEKFINMIKESGVATEDVSEPLGEMMQTKDEVELDMMKKSGAVASIVMQRYYMEELLNIVEEGKSIKHTDLSSKVGDKIENPKGLKGVPEDLEAVAPAMEPKIQSGGKYDFSWMTDSTSDKLSTDTITCLLGVRWKQYCTFVGRTVLVNAKEEQKKAYTAALEARNFICKNLKEGKTLGEVAKGAKEVIPEEFRKHLDPSFGFGTGVEWKAPGTDIVDGSSVVLKEGMVFVVQVHLNDLSADDEKFAIQIVDTVKVLPAEGADELPDDSNILTAASKVQLSDNEWNIEEPEEEPQAPIERTLRKTTVNYDTQAKGGVWARKQQEILENNRATYAKMSKEDRKNQGSKDHSVAGRLARGQIQPYPTDYVVKTGNTLEVDVANEMVQVPIGGYLVPFHASCIASTRQKTDGDKYLMTLVMRANQGDYAPFKMFPLMGYVKELTIRSRSGLKPELEQKRAQIRNMLTNIRKREQQLKDHDAVVKQEELVRRPAGPHAKLVDVYIKPMVMSGKGMQKLLGTVEAHENGLRFVAKSLPKPIDAIYSNIKHMICIPAKQERFAAVHVRLHNDILLPNGKRTGDLHFWTETGAEAEDLNARFKSDYDEELAEEREREMVFRVNREFIRFVKQMTPLLKDGSTEMPFTEGWFEGYAGSSLTIIASTPNTITSVIDTKDFFVLTVKETEVVVFERVVQGRINFDAIFVPRDYKKGVQTITNIPMKHLSQLKDLLCNVYEIKFYECEHSNNWKEILKELMNSDEWDPWAQSGENGWEGMLNADVSVSDDSSSSSESAFDPSSDEETEESSWEGASEDSSGGGGSSTSESSMDWSEAEKRASAHDRKRANDSDSERAPKKKKPRKK